MKILNVLEWVLFLSAIILLFFNWKLSILIFILASILHVIPMGPNQLLSVISGYLFIGGFAYLFINWKISLGLFILCALVVKFRTYGNKVNNEYYSNKINTVQK